MLNTPFKVNSCTPNSLKLFLIITLCTSYLLHLIIICSTDSSSWHHSHKPVSCFPIIFSDLFRAPCPSLNLVITVSSLLCPPPNLIIFTLFWICNLSLVSISLNLNRSISLFWHVCGCASHIINTRWQFNTEKQLYTRGAVY